MHDELRHLTLSFGQRTSVAFQSIVLKFRQPPLAILSTPMQNGFFQSIRNHRFEHEVNCTVLHGLHSHIHVTVPCHKDDRQCHAESSHFCVKLQSAHLRHANVQNKATCRIVLIVKKSLSLLITLNLPTDRTQHETVRVKHRLVIINNANQTSRLNPGFRQIVNFGVSIRHFLCFRQNHHGLQTKRLIALDSQSAAATFHNAGRYGKADAQTGGLAARFR